MFHESLAVTVDMAVLGCRILIESHRGKGHSSLRQQQGLAHCSTLVLTLQTCYRPKPLNSRQSTPSAPLIASGRISRAVKYASTCPRLRQATSGAPWPVFPRYRSKTSGFTLARLLSVFPYVSKPAAYHLHLVGKYGLGCINHPFDGLAVPQMSAANGRCGHIRGRSRRVVDDAR